MSTGKRTTKKPKPFDYAAEEARAEAIVSEHWATQIEGKRAAIEAGDGDALLEAIMDVVLSRKAFPEWLAYSVARAIRGYTHHKASTLDEAFGVSRPQGYRRKAVQARWDGALPVVQDVMHLQKAGVPVDDGLFEAVGELHGIGKTTASKWFYFHKSRATPTYRLCGIPTPFPARLEAVKSALIGDGVKVPRSKKKRGITPKS